MRWTSPPTRREISLVIFCLTVFTLSYNIDSSIRLVGLNRENAVLSKLGLVRAEVGPDGRRPLKSRDALESMIYGDWDWEEGRIAGDGTERSQPKGVGRHGAMWVERDEIGDLGGPTLGETTVTDAFQRWGENVPRSRLVKHTPGYTIVDNIILFNGSMTLVTEEPETFPPLHEMILPADLNRWRILSPQQARKVILPYGGRIRGVTWMAADSSPHNSTLLALWRTYSALDSEINSNGATTLTPPRRLMFPYYGFFTDPNPEHADVTTRRQRVVNGFHPELVKAAFPFMTVMYYADWEDYHKMQVPFVIERLVVADRTAASYGVDSHEPIYAPAFRKTDGLSEHWWEPIRLNLASYFGVNGDKAPKNGITYVHRQSHSNGLKLNDEDHAALVEALQKLQQDYGYEVHIVSNIDEEMSWTDRLGAITRSTLMLGVHDSDLIDCAYMQRNPHTTLMEFFPPQTFALEQQLVAKSLGMRYVAWWKERRVLVFYNVSFCLTPIHRRLSQDELPSVSRPTDGQAVPIDVSEIVKAIREVLQ
ncbi:hypothetical protein MIND_00139600 [Mycena indigotica]|uniref:Uncharacterized protein n=1 Tax=Mycena indigotica TaxID=2126181 RepID=A0A8H6TGB9_9AGAR|nr:uncharacterized protein MIND_00139600 [Mycena indigotica]KAF7316212.1 hypothetical protein MIND_00139600 [Mycena indigotica]